jgi:16S rRNA (cytidine1402-2'-O)-methyltransferase
MPTIYIVATPIGNLGDITHRAIEVLEQADVILCEDTRVTKKLTERYALNAWLKSYHQHSEEKVVREIQTLLDEGNTVALVTDAGTPGISDPGNKLIHDLRADVEFIPIPGPSAIIAALSVSGFRTDKFLFLGFPPHKKKRQSFFQEVAESKYTVGFYESCHRFEKCLHALAEVLPEDKQICVCRELTKSFESIYRGTAQELLAMEIPTKGEFVIIVS